MSYLLKEFITPCELTGHQIIVRKILTSLFYFVNWVEGHIVFVFGGFKLVWYTLSYKELVVQNGWVAVVVIAKNNRNNNLDTSIYEETKVKKT